MAGVVVEMTGDEARLWRAYQRIITQQVRMEQRGTTGAKRVKTETDGLVTSLHSLVSRYASIGSIIGGFVSLSQILSEVQREGEAAAQQLGTVVEEARKLAQISAGGAPEIMAGMKAAQLMALQSGMSVAGAQNMVFMARTLGLSPEDAAQVARARLIGKSDESVAGFMTAVGKFKGSEMFGAGAGTAEQIMSALLAAGGPVPADQLGTAAIKAAGAMRMVGGDLDELLGMMSAISGGFASPDEAAGAIKGLAALVEQKGYGGKGLMAGLQEFRAARPKEFEAAIGGSARLARGWQVISDAEAEGQIAQRVEDVRAARESGELYRSQLRAVQGVPQLSLMQRRAQARLMHEIAGEQLGEKDVAYDTALDLYKTRSIMRGESPFVRALEVGISRLQRYFRGSEYGERKLRETMYLEREMRGESRLVRPHGIPHPMPAEAPPTSFFGQELSQEITQLLSRQEALLRQIAESNRQMAENDRRGLTSRDGLANSSPDYVE